MDLSPEPVPLTVCENCAGEDDELVWVWPLPAGSSEGPELWCSDCRDRFPYEEADEPEESGAG